MKKIYTIHITVFAIVIIGVTNTICIAQDKNQEELKALVNMMSGEFSSEQQSTEDTLFYNINLVMYPIWESDQSAKWLYVEQAVTAYIDKPYRQRIYRVSMTGDNVFESMVFELENPTEFVQGWNNPEVFNQITPDSLISRNGCAVYLKKKGNCYSGSTNEKDCKSDFRGAAYATSVVSVCADQVISWDQGWNSDDQQVWGAETGGYIFKRKK